MFITFFLNGTNICFFLQLFGNVWLLTQFLNRIVSGFKVAESHIFDIVIDISSYPCDLHGSAALITLIISLFSNLIQEIVVFVICLWQSVMLLSLFNGTYCDANNLSKMFAVFLKSETRVLPTWCGGVSCTVLPL